jgi:hypothetical protein
MSSFGSKFDLFRKIFNFADIKSRRGPTQACRVVVETLAFVS